VQVTGALPSIAQAVGASESIFDVLDRIPKCAFVNCTAGLHSACSGFCCRIKYLGGKTLAHVKGHVEFRDVTFAYPSASKKVRPRAALWTHSLLLFARLCWSTSIWW
jgi:hypothetical protein